MSSPIMPPEFKQTSSIGIEIIERHIPGSTITISISVGIGTSGKIELKGSVRKNQESENETIENVPIESLPGLSHENMTFNQAMESLKKRSVDYICDKIIFLPESPLTLYEYWRSQNDSKEEKNNVDQLTHLANIIKTNKASEEAVNAYIELGYSYFNHSKYRDALLCFHHLFIVANDIQDEESVALAHRHLGGVYHKLGETQKAFDHYLNELKIFEILGDGENIAEANYNLGNVFESRGDFEKSIKCFRKYLVFVSEFSPHQVGMACASLGSSCYSYELYLEAEMYFLLSLMSEKSRIGLNGLGLIYKVQGKFNEALILFKEASTMGSDGTDDGEIYANIGHCLSELGNHTESFEYHHKDLTRAEEIENRESEARACYNIGALHLKLGQNTQSHIYLKRAFSFVDKIQDQELTMMMSTCVGISQTSNGEYEEAIQSHDLVLKIAIKNNHLKEQVYALCGLGKAYFCLKDYDISLTCYTCAYSIEKKLENLEGMAAILNNIGYLNYTLNLDEKAISNFNDSIEIYSILHEKNCKENLQWQISFYETQYRPYQHLVETLFRNDALQALLKADSSRSKGLVSLLRKKLNHAETHLSLDHMKEICKKFQTTLVIYSFSACDDTKVYCWVITSNNMTQHCLTLTQNSETTISYEDDSEIQRSSLSNNGKRIQHTISEWITDVEQEACRGPENGIDQYHLDQLSQWHKDLIGPIDHLLPKNGERVTIIPDAFLHDLPFSLFRNPQGCYLFEQCTLNTVPSIETFLCIDALTKQNEHTRKSNDVFIVRNSQANKEFDLPELKEVKEEEKQVSQHFKTPFKSYDNTEEIKKRMCESGHIHIACHGLPESKKNIHSVFAGALDIPGNLFYTEDIVELSLNAETAFLSACGSGVAKIYHEGSIGLPFAFLAAGVSSVIATRWKIFDKATVSIANHFYEHYLRKTDQARIALLSGKPFGQAEALREAMLFAKEHYPDRPQIWGAFFLTGLPGSSLERISTDQVMNPSLSIIWEDDKYKIQFQLENTVMKTCLYLKNPISVPEGINFPETAIRVQMTSLGLLRTGVKQRECQLLQLTQNEKNELFESISNRKLTIKDGQIIIRAQT